MLPQVVDPTRREVIDYRDVKAFVNKQIDHVASDEASTAGYDCPVCHVRPIQLPEQF